MSQNLVFLGPYWYHSNRGELLFHVVGENLCSWPTVKRKARIYSIFMHDNRKPMLANYSRCKICHMAGNRQISANFLIWLMYDSTCLFFISLHGRHLQSLLQVTLLNCYHVKHFEICWIWLLRNIIARVNGYGLL